MIVEGAIVLIEAIVIIGMIAFLDALMWLLLVKNDHKD